jgi:RNA-directed DNA polymerase
LASVRAVTRVNVEQASKSSMWRLTWPYLRESCIAGEESDIGTQRLHRGSDDGTYTTRIEATRETPSRGRARDQPEAREGQIGRGGESDGLVVPGKPGNAGGGKEPSFKPMWKVVKEGGLGNLETPPSVRKLQTALHAKAKAEPEFRFYLLYDKMYRADVLSFAYARCKANGGAAGVDGQTFEDIEAYGGRDQGAEGLVTPANVTEWNPWLGELAEELRNKTYRPQAVRRVYIPKPNSKKMRPLGIATIRDRVVQTAAMLVLEPIFEADLEPEQYAYRAGKNALEAVETVNRLLNLGYTDVVDADLRGYFDEIPHGPLMQSVARRICDRHMLHLIKMWIEAPVEETDDRGRKRRTTQNRDQQRGIPQGSPISPVLANLYMRRLVLWWRQSGVRRRLKAVMVNYADDLVICCKGTADIAMQTLREAVKKLQLAVNEDKTRICRVPEGSFDFLGYTFGRCYSRKTGKAHLNSWPSRKGIKRVCDAIRDETGRHRTTQSADRLVKRLNAKLIGWANYFRLGPVSPAYRAVDAHAKRRLRKWLCKKHRVQGQGYNRYPDQYLYETLRLVRLPGLTRNLPWAKA